MARIILKNEEELEYVIHEVDAIKKEISRLFELQNKEFESINGTEIWKSKTQAALSTKYDKLKKNYTDIDDSFNNYIDFMQGALNGYREYKASSINNIDNSNNSLQAYTNRDEKIIT